MRIDRVKLIAEMARKMMRVSDLASASGVSCVAISSARSGKSCKAETVERIACALGVDVMEIMEDSSAEARR